MSPVFIHHAEVACALGRNISASVRALRDGGVLPAMRRIEPAGDFFPYYVIPDELDKARDADRRGQDLVQWVAQPEKQPYNRNGLLLIASSSLNIGAVEQGAAMTDYRDFAKRVAAWLNWEGPVFVVNTACTSGMNALLAAKAMLEKDEVPEALVLGIELENRLTQGGFLGLQLLSPDAAQPFGAARNGLVLGESVSAIHLTKKPSAWRLLGGANVLAGDQPTGASASAVTRMCQAALKDSGLEPAHIDLIKVQAAGSVSNDLAEAQGLLNAFSDVPALVSLKSHLGHTMGASGVSEAVLLMGCLTEGVWPAADYPQDDTLGVALAHKAPSRLQHVMVNILGFGGSHASVVLARCA